MVDASAIRVGTVFVQADEKRQMQVISGNSPIFTESEEKSAVTYNELTHIVYALEIYGFFGKWLWTTHCNFNGSQTNAHSMCSEGQNIAPIFHVSNFFNTIPKTYCFLDKGTKTLLIWFFNRKVINQAS